MSSDNLAHILQIAIVVWGAELAIVQRLNGLPSKRREADLRWTVGFLVLVLFGISLIAPPVGALILTGIISAHAVAVGALYFAQPPHHDARMAGPRLKTS